PLGKPLADAWRRATLELAHGESGDRTGRARQIMAAESLGGEPVNADFFQRGLAELAGAAATPSAYTRLLKELALDSAAPLSRGSACRLMFAVLGGHDGSSGPASKLAEKVSIPQ